MDRGTAERLITCYARVLDSLNAAISAVDEIADRDEQKRVLRSLAQIAAHLSIDLIGPIVSEYPELDPHKEEPEPYGPLSAEESALVSQLNDNQLKLIDEALLAEADVHWRKVARVVGSAMRKPTHVRGVPDIFYAQRVRKLVEAGRLESQGNLEYMRFSEVRLLKGATSADT
jgi:hypothetical protein